jgi:uncharacterized protein
MAKDASPFSVLVRDLPVHRKFEVPATLVGEWLKGMPMREALGAPEPDPDAGQGNAELDLYADGTHVFAAGTFKGHVTVACSRCVGPARLDIDETLRVTFMPPGEMPSEDNEPAAQSAPGNDGGPGEGEGALVAEEDLDVFAYDGEKIDLEPLFREQFVLAIPYAPLCSETCKGLCPQCGIDLNSGTCTCEKPIDPRLAALKGLKLPS